MKLATQLVVLVLSPAAALALPLVPALPPALDHISQVCLTKKHRNKDPRVFIYILKKEKFFALIFTLTETQLVDLVVALSLMAAPVAVLPLAAGPAALVRAIVATHLAATMVSTMTAAAPVAVLPPAMALSAPLSPVTVTHPHPLIPGEGWKYHKIYIHILFHLYLTVSAVRSETFLNVSYA